MATLQCENKKKNQKPIAHRLHESSHSLICDEVYFIIGRILVEKNIDKRVYSKFCHFSWLFYLKTRGENYGINR
jgi:hypothetical protein